ncbi:MAG: hypothetical protein PHI34_12230, partial [Acidobacteriota bacterium]|nr:hypothetical protein [Acidobacteriota bacterium]
SGPPPTFRTVPRMVRLGLLSKELLSFDFNRNEREARTTAVDFSADPRLKHRVAKPVVLRLLPLGYRQSKALSCGGGFRVK